ncbi:MAG TPA: hypothetical protein VII92_08960, partial [Anaerolineae bacterium]
MFFVTWLFGGLLSLTEMRRRGTLAAKDMPPAIGVYYLISFVMALIFWLILAGQILSLGGIVQANKITNLDQFAAYAGMLLTLADSIGNILVLFYLFVFLIIVGMALSMLGEARTWFGKLAGDWGLIASAPIALALIIAISATNLNAIRADTIYKQADPLRNAGQWDIGIAHYKRVLELAPDEDFYYLWLGAAYLEKAANAPATPDMLTSSSTLEGVLGMNVVQTYQLNRKDSLQAAEVILKHARDLNPLNTDHSANLARLYRRWADLSTDPAQRKANLDKANEQYREATTLSPNNAVLWNEWATVAMSYADLNRQTEDNAGADAHLQEAQARLDHSLEIDNQYEPTQLYRAQLARFLGKSDEAVQAYQNALKINPNSTDAVSGLLDLFSSTQNYTAAETVATSFLTDHPDSLIALRTLASNVYFPTNRIQQALTTQQRVIQLSAKDANAWNDHRVFAIMLFQIGQLPAALQEAQTALSLAPQDQQPNVQSLVTEIQKQMNGGLVPTNTLPVTAPVP